MPSNEYLAARESVKEAVAKARALAKEAFTKEASTLLNDLGIDSFSWTQYTPYFNDGDICVFGVNADWDYSVQINGHPLTDFWKYDWQDTKEYFLRDITDNYNDWDDEIERSEGEFVPPVSAYRDVGEFINSFDEDDLEYMFGEGLVVVTKDGITTDYYEHD